MIRLPSDGWARVQIPVMDCGHPLAARQIVRVDDSTAGLRTVCWACAVQRDVVSNIVGPKAAKRRDVAS